MSSIKPVPASPPQLSGPSEPQTGLHSRPTAVEMARAARRKRARRLLRNLAIWVGLPTLLGVLYFTAIAQNQFESFATLSVPPAQAALLREYVMSRDMLQNLDAQVQFSKHLQRAGDGLFGLASDAGSEERFQAYLGRVDVRSEQTGLLRLKVRAFSATEAQRAAQTIVHELNAFWSKEALDPAARLIVVSRPSLPTEHTYPRRLYGMLTVFFVSFALFAIGSLLIAAAREHAQF